jgi:hypothetical protein
MKIARLSLLYSIVILAVAARAGAVCTCSPTMKSGYSINATYSVYIDPSLSSVELEAVQTALQQWNDAIAGSSYTGTATMFTYASTPSQASLWIYEDPSLAGTTTGAAFDPGSIRLNPDYRNRSDFMKDVALHEVGHAVGFQDVYTSGCNGSTVMYGIIDPNASSYMAASGGDDDCAVTREWDRYNHERFRDPSCGFGCQEGSGADSPIVINFANGDYSLTGSDAPVSFDMRATGHPISIGWTAAATAQAFLCVDRDGDGAITSGAELFGNATPLNDGQRADNGFQALAELDDNHDGIIDDRDSIWGSLLLWTDTNHNGISEPSELMPASDSPLEGIVLDYHWAGRHDAFGNLFRYQSRVLIRRQAHVVSAPVYDIFFAELQ